MDNNESRPPNLPDITNVSKRTTRTRSPPPTFITPRPKNIARSRSRSPSPHPISKLPHDIHAISSAPCLPVSFNRNFLRVDKGAINASDLSIPQIKFLDEFERHMFLKLDFTRCNDQFIFDAVGNAPSYSTYIPLE